MLIRTSMDAGPAKQRRTGKRPQVLQVAFSMNDPQIVAFEAFVSDTLLGVRRFGIPHPRLNSQVEVRIIPEDGGKLYTISRVAPGLWLVSFNMEVMP